MAVAHNHFGAEARQKWEAARKRVVQEGAWDDLKVSANSVTTRFVDIAPRWFHRSVTFGGTSCSHLGKEPIARAHIAAAEAIIAFRKRAGRSLMSLARDPRCLLSTRQMPTRS